MKCKELKITVKQYDTVLSKLDKKVISICKITIVADSEKLVGVMQIAPNLNAMYDSVLYEFFLRHRIRDEIDFIELRAIHQMEVDKLYGIDTYYKWSAKS